MNIMGGKGQAFTDANRTQCYYKKERCYMRTPKRGKIEDARMLTIEQLCQYTSLGRTRAREFADRIGATKKFGERMVRFDKRVIDNYLDAQAAVTETA